MNTDDIAINSFSALFERVRFVLVAPRMAANVGAAARAIKTMGFSRLVVVSEEPFKLNQADAIALSSGAQDILAGAQRCTTLDEALTGCTSVVALTARPREWSGLVVNLPEHAAASVAPIAAGEEIAFVFGNERFGLSNEDILRCGNICTIAANPSYSSLNLSQAVQVCAYALRMELLKVDAGTNTTAAIEPEIAKETPATQDQIQASLAHWLAVLEQIGYYKPAEPRRLKQRLASVFARAQLTTADIDMLRGIAAAVEKTHPLKTKL